MTKITSIAKLKTGGFLRISGSLPYLRFGSFSASSPLKVEWGWAKILANLFLRVFVQGILANQFLAAHTS